MHNMQYHLFNLFSPVFFPYIQADKYFIVFEKIMAFPIFLLDVSYINDVYYTCRLENLSDTLTLIGKINRIYYNTNGGNYSNERKSCISIFRWS